MTDRTDRDAFGYGHGWLPVAVPATTRRFRVSNPQLRKTLERAGATLADGGAADVEIGRFRQLRRDTPVSIALAPDYGAGSTSSLAGRAFGRLARGLALRIWLLATTFAFRRRRFHTRRLLFDLEQHVWFDRVHPTRLAETLPRYGAIVASRTDFEPSLLDEVCAVATMMTGKSFTRRNPTLRAAMLVNVGDEAVLRVALGDARRLLRDQVDVLATLGSHGPPSSVAAVVPKILGEGSTGLASWTVESRLPGKPLSATLTSQQLDESVDFIVTLGGVARGTAPADPLASAPPAIGAAIGPEAARAAEVVARRAADVLGGAPTVFGHGDFFSGNLLGEEGRLSGVVDWEGGGPGALPLLDLLHLILHHETNADVYAWGPAVASNIMELAERTNGHVQEYLDRLELSFDRAERRALGASYWLTRIAYQLSTYAGRAADRRWVSQSVDVPARALLAG